MRDADRSKKKSEHEASVRTRSARRGAVTPEDEAEWIEERRDDITTVQNDRGYRNPDAPGRHRKPEEL